MKLTDRKRYLALAVLVATGLLTPSTHAALLFSNYTGANPGTTGGADALWGTEFTLGPANLTVDQLGAWDYQLDGFTHTQRVGLWEVSTGNLITSTTIPNGTAAPLIEQWRFADIAPVELQANTSYRIGAFYEVAGFDAPPVSTGPSFDLHPGLASAGSGANSSFTEQSFTMPTLPNIRGRVAGNANISAVPIPAALPLLLTGLLSIGWLSRRRKQR